MFNLGWQEILLILLVILLLFGARKIPELARGLGKGVREFRRALKTDVDAEEPPTPAAPPDASKPKK